MTQDETYELVLTPSARRAVPEDLPEAVAAEVREFLTGPLVVEPRRVGKPLHGELAGICLARRGTSRVLYRVREQQHEVVVRRIEHCRNAYRPR